MLRIYSTYKQDQWDEYLSAAEFAYNNAKQASTGFTPFEFDCGQHPNTSMTLTYPETRHVPAADDFMYHWNIMIKMAKITRPNMPTNIDIIKYSKKETKSYCPYETSTIP